VCSPLFLAPVEIGYLVIPLFPLIPGYLFLTFEVAQLPLVFVEFLITFLPYRCVLDLLAEFSLLFDQTDDRRLDSL
jgi:hypothetical protein